MKIDSNQIGKSYPPFIVAEMSGNHNQSLERALKIIDMAAEAGADAIKIQTYTADTITLKSDKEDFLIKDKSSLWAGENLHSLYEKAHTPWEWHEKIFDYSKKKGISCFSSPFDESAIEFLEKFNPPAYKIASFENNHLPLIKCAAKTKKPLIISTGMATVSEIENAVNTTREQGCEDIVLLKCTSTYPASPSNSNISTLPHLKSLFNTEVGISDHTLGIGVPLVSIGYGATFIEKHFTLNRSDGGVDSQFSLEPHELKSLVIESKRAWESIGNITYGSSSEEKSSMIFKRSIYVAKDIKKGELFNQSNLRVIRPGYGCSPKFYESLIGKQAKKDFMAGTPLNIKDIF